MSDYKERVFLEKISLDEKINKLDSFLNTETFNELPYIERSLLAQQVQIMLMYSAILSRRLERFEGEQ